MPQFCIKDKTTLKMIQDFEKKICILLNCIINKFMKKHTYMI